MKSIRVLSRVLSLAAAGFIKLTALFGDLFRRRFSTSVNWVGQAAEPPQRRDTRNDYAVPNHAAHGAGRSRGQDFQPTLAPNGAHSEQHGIGRREIVGPTSGDEQYCQGDQVHPADHAVRFTLLFEEQKIQSRDPERHGDRVRDRPELRGQEAVCAAHPDVARMDEPQKVERDEIVPDLPDEIGKENQEADGGAAPQPFALAGVFDYGSGCDSSAAALV